ncbi:Txe/YoeB family addiction module toxin [Sunxiuqinia sp. sy24]|uniref:Txe/YoeB family addiction module toxin n=1 Tax=Sunxiuqinia sp. sy24 TaxID=3461495 RepID=UPI0040467618
MRTIEFVPAAFKEYQQWIELDRKVALRIGDLIRDIIRHPFDGIGKPEALKHQFKGYWSRRIDREHRLIYSVTDHSVLIISCYSHY